MRSLQTETATVSGKLIAGNVQAENIKILEEQVSSLSHQTNSSNESYSQSINDIQKLLTDIKNQPMPDLTNQTNLANLTNLSDQSLATPAGTIADNCTEQACLFPTLTVTGTANLYTVSVSNSLLVGTTLFENNTIVSLASELKLTALEKINLFDGAVVIAKDGSITTRGELIAQGGIRTNEIRAVNDGENINIHLSPNTPNSPNTPKLNISNQLDQTVASIDASGSAYCKALALEKFTPATPEAAIIAANDNFQKNGLFAPAFETATASAGLALLPENQSEVVIYNDNVKKDSLIYLTPTTPTAPIALTVSTKVYDTDKPYFRVSSPAPTSTPTNFNWLIIN